jgi:DNA mismatch endonuclease (patch repair protein)
LSDTFTPAERSRVMSKIRSRDTILEVRFRSQLWHRGIRYVTHFGPSRIDVAIPSLKVAIFLDSCFWHYCPNHGVLPKTRRTYWIGKLTGNRARDTRVTAGLRAEGWTVWRIWSHELELDNDAVVERVCESILRHRTDVRRAPKARGRSRGTPALGAHPPRPTHRKP